ncbi:CBS domain-containing protein [Schaalia sp. JY-X169]|uniref:CBS domain-containing protein n=1 Tax=Schaalia sp. JY-X169 TaxID=2758572 RepID=UPI0015F5AF39|nr:CBS domain-containing protein [Schaalia sp. JY-X169]
MIVEQHVDEDDPPSATDSAQDSPTSNEPNLESDEELHKRVEALLARAEGGSTEKVAVTDLLSFFGHKKLGRRIKVRVDEQLKARNITATPPFESADRWGEITLRSTDQWTPDQAQTVRLPVSALSDEDYDFASVLPNETITKARTLMIKYNFSQIPVIAPNRKELLGNITWQSIAGRMGQTESTEAKNWMVPGGYVAQSSDDLMDLVPHILKDEFIYYRDAHGFIVGIATASDLAASFRSATGIFLSLAEIEGRLRSLIYKLDVRDVINCLPEHARSSYKGVDDLSFSDYISILGAKNWKTLGLELDRSVCIESLREVAKVRNRLMHFRQTLSNDEDEPVVEHCLSWLRAVHPETD